MISRRVVILYIFLSCTIFSVYSNDRSVINTGSISKPFSKVNFADDAPTIIEYILQALGLKATFQVKPANIPNAAAVVFHGKRYILYNPSFIAAMDKAAGTRWASVAILAHEIGHHLNGHTLDGKGSLPPIELEADEFSGFVLRKLGAGLGEAQIAMRILANTRATSTHPAKSERLLAIEKGWKRADYQMNENDLAFEEEELKPSATGEEYLAYDVVFVNDPESKYHVTTRNNFVKAVNDRVYHLGKLLSTGESAFPLAFHTNDDDYLFVSSKGQVLNKKGKLLGYLRKRA